MIGGPENSPIQVEQLTESYRFDGELAGLLTRFQYHRDDITLTAADPHPLPSSAYTASTAGLATVFDSSSLVFVCYDDRSHQMVNPIEISITQAIADAISSPSAARPDGGSADFVGEGSTESVAGGPPDAANQRDGDDQSTPSFGVVTPHNAQRGALDMRLDDEMTANTVEKYQGGERDIIAVSATVSDPEFARCEERFILDPNRLLVAISRSRQLTVVVCSTSLFEVAPKDTEQLESGPVWARLFTQAMGQDPSPAWTGELAEFVSDSVDTHATVPVQVYHSDQVESD
jgi:hypothetical protein